jgi:hypothetical protein
MPAITVAKTPIARDPGYLYYGPLATSLPANTVAGSVFTDTWPAGWAPWGVTRSGSEFQYSVTTDNIEAAEYLDPLVIVTTGRAAQVAFECIILSATTMKRALNGGTVTTSGSGATLLTTVTPPIPGAEVRSMVGWEAQDGTERMVMEQVFQAGTITIGRAKGSANAGVTMEFHAELPSSGFPFQYFTAGAARG